MLVLLDAAALCFMPTAALSEVRAERAWAAAAQAVGHADRVSLHTAAVPTDPSQQTAACEPAASSLPPTHVHTHFSPACLHVQVLSHMQRLQAASPDAHWLWGVAAAPADLAALQAAAEHGHTPAADNWQLWQRSSTARQLTPAELSSSAGHDGMPPAVVHASKAARVHAACCRLVYLCSSHEGGWGPGDSSVWRGQLGYAPMVPTAWQCLQGLL